MSSEQPFIIVNPCSGRGTSEQKWASMVSLIHKYLGSFECEFTTGRGDAIGMAHREARNGRKLIIAMGGDGTSSEVANGILQSGAEAELGILPRGTGGDFRRTLNVPGSLEQAARKLRDGSTHRMDAGRIRFISHQGSEETRYFINTASFGMSGKVAGRANESSKRFGGMFTYAVATFQTVLTYNYPEVILQWDDQPDRRLKIITVCIANGPSFGGGMKIAPDAKVNDGFFDVVVIGDLKTPRVLMSSYRLYTGSFLSLEKVALVHAQKITAVPVDAALEVLLEVDGETPGRLPATFEILPAALRIRC